MRIGFGNVNIGALLLGGGDKGKLGESRILDGAENVDHGSVAEILVGPEKEVVFRLLSRSSFSRRTSASMVTV